MNAIIGMLALVVAQSPVVGSPVCGSCGVRWVAIDSNIARLKGSHRPHEREDAAEVLGRVKWMCHPEVVHALADALRFDPKDDVREEAAESLERMGACDPEAHLALRKAALSDRDGGVRKKSRKALASLPSRCLADCMVCGPTPVTPTKRLLTDGSYIVPGSERIVESTPGLLEPVQPSPVPIPTRRPSAVLDPEDTPPPPPTPVVVPPPAVQSNRNPAPLPPAASDAAVRRSSAKPVAPPVPSSVPPLEGPMP